MKCSTDGSRCLTTDWRMEWDEMGKSPEARVCKQAAPALRTRSRYAMGLDTGERRCSVQMLFLSKQNLSKMDEGKRAVAKSCFMGILLWEAPSHSSGSRSLPGTRCFAWAIARGRMCQKASFLPHFPTSWEGNHLYFTSVIVLLRFRPTYRRGDRVQYSPLQPV